MTMQQIDITSETNGGHVIKLVDATLGMEREITVAAPSPGKKTMSDALVNLIPIPDETPETTLQHAIAALDDITNPDSYIHVDVSDICRACREAPTATICFECDSPDAIGRALDAKLSDSNIPASAIARTLFSIVCRKDVSETELSSAVKSLRRHLKDQATFTFGVRFTDISSTFRITALLAVSQEW